MGIFTSKWEDIICECGKPAKSYDGWCDCPCHIPEAERIKKKEKNEDTPYGGDVEESKRIIDKIRNILKNNIS